MDPEKKVKKRKKTEYKEEDIPIIKANRKTSEPAKHVCEICDVNISTRDLSSCQVCESCVEIREKNQTICDSEKVSSKNFSCDICGKCFTSSTGLSYHVKSAVCINRKRNDELRKGDNGLL